MAQVAGGVSVSDFKLEISTDAGVSWTDISGAANSCTPSGGELAVGEVNTFEGDWPILTAGKFTPVEYTVRVVYTEGAGEAWTLLRTAAAAKGSAKIRLTPKGGTVGDARQTVTGFVTSPGLVGGDASSADSVLVEFRIRGTSPVFDATP